MFVYDNNNVLIELIADNVYLVRGYKEGTRFPEPSAWVLTALVKEDLVHLMGLVSTGERDLKNTREIHKFFKSLGYKKCEYFRDRGQGALYNVTREYKCQV